MTLLALGRGVAAAATLALIAPPAAACQAEIALQSFAETRWSPGGAWIELVFAVATGTPAPTDGRFAYTVEVAGENGRITFDGTQSWEAQAGPAFELRARFKIGPYDDFKGGLRVHPGETRCRIVG